MSESTKRERFGRYLILDHLVDGGMAKICRARFLGEQADKVVAIKMVQPQYSKDEGFKTMFMDEIKVTFGLIHPNVIQTYDYGMHKEQLYVAMEYCDGRNLKEYLEKLKERKFVFPVEISTYIISQACQGLFYAHTFRDKLTGLEANIIHRDISPHNIMLTYDGSIKIIDFGIAKSQTNSEATQAGTIKGKLSYLAPEYLEGMELDARYDQFALGITLWEMLCSRKLFKENNDLAVLKKIQQCKIPVPSSINPNVPAELDEIVLKALSKDRTKRYDNLDQMNRALMKFLYAKYPDFNATDLSYFSQELFREEIKKDREKMFEFGKVDIRPYLDDLKKELEGGTKDSSNVQSSSNQTQKIKAKELDFGFDENANGKVKGRPTSKKQNSNNDDTNIVKDNTGSRTDIELGNSKSLASKNQQTKVLNRKTDSTRTRINKEDEQVKNTNSPNPAKVAIFATLVAGAGYFYFSNSSSSKPGHSAKVSSVPTKDMRKPAQVVPLETEKVASEIKGNVVLSHFDKQKMQIFVDGQKMEVDLLSNIKVPLGKDFTIRVQIDGRKHFIKEMRVDNESAVEIEIPEMPQMSYGYVNTSMACAEGEIRYEVLGEKRVSAIPLSQSFGIAFPVSFDDKGQAIPKDYEIFFKRKGEEVERKIDITVNHEDQTIDLCDKF